MTWTRFVMGMTVAAALLASSPTAAGSTDPIGVWPFSPEPVIHRRFEPPLTPYGAGHRGVDLIGAVHQPVRTALPGVVTYAGLLAGRGVVVVSHGQTRTTYEPVLATVDLGATVAAGDPIGQLQATASHCPPRACLHWGWLDGTTYLDPLRLVGLGPVRLLPLWRDAPLGPVTPSARLTLAGALDGMRLAIGLW